ncbi:hypothetical protein [Bacillus infantis]|uniref:hypothetical protein n=1 Tax=Bacillus infantis TaxID=324767 RepID=UPI003CFB558B
MNINKLMMKDLMMEQEGEIVSEEKVIINIPSVEEWNITQLRYTCKKNKVKGYTKMDRDELIVAVKDILSKLKSK